MRIIMRGFTENDQRLRTLRLSTIAITTVVLVEVTLGLAVSSLSILSDGLHALFDALTMIVLLITTRSSLKPPDEEHMYGHEKIESIGALIGGVVLIGVSALIMIESIFRLVGNRPFIDLNLGFVGFIAIGYTFAIDLFRIGIFFRARRSESATMEAGLHHAIADFSSTIIALFGFGLATVGVYSGDSVASMILSVLLAFLSARLVWNSGMELSDAISKDVVAEVRREILSVEDAFECEKLKVRKSGERFFVEATLKVPDYISLEEAHGTSAKIESNIRAALGKAEITFHIEPKGTKRMPTEKLIEKLATEQQAVKEVHEVSIAYTKGKLYVTLHAQVDPRMSIEEAHEIAETIENKVDRNLKNVANITVHVEPFSAESRRGYAIDENKLRNIIQKVAENYQKDLQIKRIVTYVAGERRHINIDCVFSGKTSIEDAHKIASEAEEQVKKRFAETIVTVHMEPSAAENNCKGARGTDAEQISFDYGDVIER